MTEQKSKKRNCECPGSHTKEERDAMLKQMGEAQCFWPECEEKNMMHVAIPMGQVLEGGRIEASEGMSLTVPCCMYHMLIAGNGDFCLIEQDGRQQLHGPMAPLMLMENVIHAMIISGKMNKLLLEYKKQTEEHQKMRAELDKKKQETDKVIDEADKQAE
ncbi:MAG: hypothetical protein GY861_17165 [bacterium]|nr:hypothetical protein [bacterium]